MRKCDLRNRNIYFGALSKSSKTAKSFFLTGHLQVINRALPRIPRMETGLGFNVSSAGSAGNSPRSIISSFDSRERSTAQHPAFPFMVTIDGASRMKSVSLNSNTMNSILQVVLTLTLQVAGPYIPWHGFVPSAPRPASFISAPSRLTVIVVKWNRHHGSHQYVR